MAATQDEEDSRVREDDAIRFDGGQIAGLVASSALWAWLFAVMFSDAVVGVGTQAAGAGLLYRCCAFAAMACTCIAFLFAGRALHSRRRGLFLTLGAMLLSPWVCVCSALGVYSQEALLPVALLSWVLFGASVAILQSVAIAFLRKLTARTTVLALGFSTTLGSILYGFALSLGPSAPALVVCLPVLSSLCWCATGVFGRLDDERELISEPAPGRVLANAFHIHPEQLFFGLLFGLALSLGMQLVPAAHVGFPLAVEFAFCLGGPLMVIIAALPRPIDTETLRWFLLPLSVTGMLLMLLGGVGAVVASCALIAFCFGFFDLLQTLLLVELTRESEDNAPYVFASSRAYLYAGVACGWLVPYAVCSMSGLSGMPSRIIVLVAASAVVFVIAYIGRPSTRDRSEPVVMPHADEDAVFEQRCRKVASAAGLSPRQAEIFAMLAKGRNAPYIEEELTISYHTVKAHIYRIYQKLEVHSQQELIDLVDTRDMRRSDPE